MQMEIYIHTYSQLAIRKLQESGIRNGIMSLCIFIYSTKFNSYKVLRMGDYTSTLTIEIGTFEFTSYFYEQFSLLVLKKYKTTHLGPITIFF